MYLATIMKSLKTNQILIIISTFFWLGTIQNLYSQENKTSIHHLSNTILTDTIPGNKLKNNSLLLDLIRKELAIDKNAIHQIDSSALVYDLISPDKQVQILSWAILYHDIWEYYGFIKSYDSHQKAFTIFEFTPSDFNKAYEDNTTNNHKNWPASVYLKIIQTNYNNRTYYSLLGWIAKSHQTAYKTIEIVNISKNGSPTFGKSAYFFIKNKAKNRALFGYNSQSSFQLDYGEYSYITKKWNAQKRKYDIENKHDHLIVFDHLIPMYPDLKGYSEFMVPSGNVVDAFKFKKGKWLLIKDIDARNLELKKTEDNKPSLKLFPESNPQH